MATKRLREPSYLHFVRRNHTGNENLSTDGIDDLLAPKNMPYASPLVLVAQTKEEIAQQPKNVGDPLVTDEQKTKIYQKKNIEISPRVLMISKLDVVYQKMIENGHMVYKKINSGEKIKPQKETDYIFGTHTVALYLGCTPKDVEKALKEKKMDGFWVENMPSIKRGQVEISQFNLKKLKAARLYLLSEVNAL